MSVNPSSLSMDHSPSPRPESPEPGPSRKRPRTSSTSTEDRKEARAHRNRIAAQNSRDRRKAQFTYLERRVSELEEENRQLRAGLVAPSPRPDQLKTEEQERERAKELENEELRERIKSLEKGWDVVIMTLKAQGLSGALTAAAQSAAEPTNSTSTPAAASEPPTKQQPADSPSPEFPTEPTMTFPISPAPSHNSLDFDLDTLSSSSFMSSPVLTPKTEHDLDSTRHLARVASIVGGVPPPPMALQRVVSTSVSRSPVSRAPTTAAPLPRKPRSTTQPWRTCSARSSPLPRASPRRVFLLTLQVAPTSKLPPRVRRRPLPSRRK
ncbi:hypothetical protein DFH08DRAFT_205142 [Mycena albidolilacea]|uniref:X-box-binding protein 1 n=1 Tax=Mycena albidolilacea TaxID=1033008 RepID=A0AAD7A031_9AGAR|nr:hypothetical protein DFH08DRAFT_205142 [Mycena albidolilacea]